MHRASQQSHNVEEISEEASQSVPAAFSDIHNRTLKKHTLARLVECYWRVHEVFDQRPLRLGDRCVRWGVELLVRRGSRWSIRNISQDSYQITFPSGQHRDGDLKASRNVLCHRKCSIKPLEVFFKKVLTTFSNHASQVYASHVYIMHHHPVKRTPQ